LISSATTYTRWAKDATCNSNFIQSNGSWVVSLSSPSSASTLATGDFLWTGTTNSDWATTNNWRQWNGTAYVIPNSFPNSSTVNVFLPSAANCVQNNLNLNASIVSVNNMTIESGHVFKLNNANSILNVAGNLINNGTWDSPISGSTVRFNGSGSQTIPAVTFSNLQTEIGGTKTLAGLTNVSGVFTIGAATSLNLSDKILNLSYIGTSLAINGTFIPSSGTVNYSGSGSQNVASTNYYNFGTTGAGQKTLMGTVTVSNSLNLLDGTLVVGENTFNMNGSIFTREIGSFDGIGESSNFVFENANPISIPNGVFPSIIRNLSLNGEGGITLNSDLTLTGDLTLTSGSLSVGSNDLTVESNASISRTNGVINIGTGGLIYKSASLNMANFSSSAIDHVVLDRAGGTITLNGNLSVTNGFTLTDGTFDIAANTLSLNGSITHIAGVIDADAGTVNFKNASPYTISNGLFAGAIYGLGANGGELTLSEPTTVSNLLTMGGSNIIASDVNVLEIGTSKTNPGSISWTTGTIVGPLKRWFGTSANSTQESGIFPVGTSAFNRYAQINFTESTPGGYLVIKYVDGMPANSYSGLPVAFTENSANKFIQNADEDGYWEMTPFSESGVAYGALNDKTYDLFLRINNPYSVQQGGILSNPPGVRLIRAKGNVNGTHSDWEMAGTHTLTIPYTIGEDYKVGAGGVVGFSWFNGGGDNSNPLPVELLIFTGNCEEEQVTLNWSTASEHQSAYFEVEKSRNGTDWEVVCTIPAAGYSTEKLDYSFVDENSKSDESYYRLRQVDENGESETFNTILVSCDVNSEVFKTLPNPSASSFQVLVNDKSLVGKASLNMVDMKGTIVSSMNVEVVDGVNVFFLNENVAPGIYYLSLTNGLYTTEVFKHSIR